MEAAAGGIIDFQSNSNPARFVDENGKTLGGNGGAPTFGVGLDSSQLGFSPSSSPRASGQGLDQVVMDANTASDQGYVVGDTVGVAALGLVEQYEITGIGSSVP